MSDVAQPTAVVPPRTTKGKATRARLLTAASRLFAVQGYDGTSVEAVATEAGITVPGMYKHFPTKASLLLEVARRATIRSEEHTSELQSLMRISYAVFCLNKKKHIQSRNENRK